MPPTEVSETVQRPSEPQIIATFTVGAVVAAGCAASSDETAPSDDRPMITDVIDSSSPTSTGAPPATSPTTPATTATTSATPMAPVITTTVGVDDAEVAWGLPSRLPTEPSGALGHSRYVFVRDDLGDIVPVVVEGTLGEQNRCQDTERNCSYQELKALHESGAEVPAHLDMTNSELGELIAQLDLTAATVNSLPTPAEACAAGYFPVSAQNPNMGIHFVNPALLVDGFDPANPEMLLYGSEDALGMGRSEIGSCGDDGTWAGTDNLTVTGSAFFIDLTDEHPTGFTGPIDQWHIHYNSCANGEFDSNGSVALCDQNGGVWFDLQPNWMIHAYVADGFESDTGVFAIWNNSVWPVGGSASTPPRGATEVAIDQFEFGSATIGVGDSVWFSNSDQMPHVVNAGTPLNPLGDFASPLIGEGEAWQLTAEEPGVIEFYCSLHPSMVGTLIVE